MQSTMLDYIKEKKSPNYGSIESIFVNQAIDS